MEKYFNKTLQSSLAGRLSTLLIVIVTIFSCQEGHDAGDLLGQWHMIGATITGTTQNATDNKYISFSGTITEFRHVGNGVLMQNVFGNFQHVGDSLFIQCHSIDNPSADKQLIEDGYGFKPYDNIRVKIEAIDSQHLVLSKDGNIWNFEKY